MYVMALSPVIIFFLAFAFFTHLFVLFPNVYQALEGNFISSWKTPTFCSGWMRYLNNRKTISLCAFKDIHVWNKTVNPCYLHLFAVQKPGKWCAMHVYVAWMILSHQKKVKVCVSY